MREAHALASLNHADIASIDGLEHARGIRALVVLASHQVGATALVALARVYVCFAVCFALRRRGFAGFGGAGVELRWS